MPVDLAGGGRRLGNGPNRDSEGDTTMTEYLILLYERESGYAEGGQEAWQAAGEAHARFQGQVAEKGGKILGGNALQPTATATSIRDDVVTDGPFTETKEALGGHYLIEARDLDHARDIARLGPAPHGRLDGRPAPDTAGQAAAADRARRAGRARGPAARGPGRRRRCDRRRPAPAGLHLLPSRPGPRGAGGAHAAAAVRPDHGRDRAGVPGVRADHGGPGHPREEEDLRRPDSLPGAGRGGAAGPAPCPPPPGALAVHDRPHRPGRGGPGPPRPRGPSAGAGPAAPRPDAR